MAPRRFQRWRPSHLVPLHGVPSSWITELLPCPFFFFSNDELAIPAQLPPRATGLISVANGHSLHVLARLAATGSLRAAVFVDISPGQLLHLGRLYRAVQETVGGRLEYVERLLGLRLGPTATRALESLAPGDPDRILGSRDGQEYLAVERQIWADVDFDADRFYALHGISAEREAEGLRFDSVFYGQRVVQTVHVAGCATDRPGACPVTMSFGRGYLASEAAFQQFRSTLAEMETAFLLEDFGDCLEPLLDWFGEQAVAVNCSNLFHRFFVERHPTLVAALRALTLHPTAIVIRDRRDPEQQIDFLE